MERHHREIFDADPAAQASLYSSTVDWGDESDPSTSTIAAWVVEIFTSIIPKSTRRLAHFLFLSISPTPAVHRTGEH
jgi:hypothetical protein